MKKKMKDKMKSYTVTFSNTTPANDPLDAVLECLRDLKTEGSQGRCFTVYDDKGNIFSVDLDEPEGEQVL